MQRVGIIGYGSLGQYLAKAILSDKVVAQKYQLVFVWNRTKEKMNDLPDFVERATSLETVCDDFKDKVDLIIEVCHPNIVAEFGGKFLSIADLFIGSPTALADAKLEAALRAKCDKHAVYIPSGALWGAQDIQKMAGLGSLHALTITMKKHPASLKLEEPLKSKNESYLNNAGLSGEFVVYEGDVRTLCPLAPNNVNTMACAALAGHNLGFDKVKARLVADKSLEAHVIDIDVRGSESSGFRVTTERYNPAKSGAVTGNATYASFLASLKEAGGRGAGFYFV